MFPIPFILFFLGLIFIIRNAMSVENSLDSPDLLHLIQNKGKNLLDVTISAPDFVQLAERKVQI